MKNTQTLFLLKSILACLIYCLLSACNLKEDPYDPNNVGTDATKFEVRVGGSLNDFPNDVICSNDGEYVVVGYSQSFTPAGDNQAYIVKLDKQGKKRWEKNFGGQYDDYGESVVQTSDGGFVLCGRTSGVSGNQDILVVKVDNQGNKVWEKTYGGKDTTETAFGIVNSSTGNIIISYVADPPSLNFSQLRLLYLNSAGIRISDKVVQNGKFEMHAITKTSDGKLLITGSDFSNKTVSYVVKCTEDAGFIWEKRYPLIPVNYTPSFGVVELKDKSLLLAGSDIRMSGNSHDFQLMAFGEAGNDLWQLGWGGANADELFDIDLSSDNQLIVMGYTSSFSAQTEFYLSKRQANNGSKIWEKNFVEIGNQWGAMDACNDGGFILVGGENKANADIVVIKTDGNGNYK